MLQRLLMAQTLITFKDRNYELDYIKKRKRLQPGK